MSLAFTSSHCASAGKQARGLRKGAKDRGGGTGGTVRAVSSLWVSSPTGKHRIQKIQKSVDKIPDFGD